MTPYLQAASILFSIFAASSAMPEGDKAKDMFYLPTVFMSKSESRGGKSGISKGFDLSSLAGLLAGGIGELKGGGGGKSAMDSAMYWMGMDPIGKGSAMMDWSAKGLDLGATGWPEGHGGGGKGLDLKGIDLSAILSAFPSKAAGGGGTAKVGKELDISALLGKAGKGLDLHGIDLSGLLSKAGKAVDLSGIDLSGILSKVGKGLDLTGIDLSSLLNKKVGAPKSGGSKVLDLISAIDLNALLGKGDEKSHGVIGKAIDLSALLGKGDKGAESMKGIDWAGAGKEMDWSAAMSKMGGDGKGKSPGILVDWSAFMGKGWW